MSSPISMVTAEVISSLIASINCGNAVFTMLVYDWLVCLDQEIALIWNWKTRRTVAPFIYILARYMPIAQSALTVTTIFPMSFLSCEVMLWVQWMSVTLSFSTPAVFSAIRTYALSGRNIYLTITTFFLSIAPAVSSMINFFKFESLHDLPSPFNCSTADSIPPELKYKLIMISRACMILADLLVVVITWMNTYKSYKIQKSLRFDSSLASIMLYNGSLYFVVMASLNVLQMIFTALQIDSVFLDNDGTGGYVTIFLDPITYILICHFLLNLRQVDRDTADPSLPSTQNNNMSIQFATQHSTTLPAFIGSLGESVHVGSTIDPDFDFEGESPDPVQSEKWIEVAEVNRV